MNFFDLVCTVDFEQIWSALKLNYNLRAKEEKSYRHAWNELRQLKPQKGEIPLSIIVAKCEDELEPGTFYYHVCGYNPKDGEYYDIVLNPWAEWLTYKISDKSLELYGYASSAAHCLYEMTFFGTNPKQIDAAAVDLLKEIENATQQVAIGETFPINDLLPDFYAESKKENEVSRDITEAISKRNQALLDELEKNL